MTCRVKERRSRKVDKRRRAKLRLNRDQARVSQLQERILRTAGLWKMLSSIGNPLPVLKVLRAPVIEVERGIDSTTDPALIQMVDEIRQLLTTGVFVHPTMPAGITNQEFFAVAAPLLRILARCRGPLGDSESETVARSVRHAVQRLQPEALGAQCHESLCQQIRAIVLKYSRMNRNVYYITTKWACGFTCHVHKAAPRFRTFTVDDGRRFAFQCAHNASCDAVNWVQWDGEALGLCGVAGKLPVFVQQHVLDRIVGPYSRLSKFVGTESSLHELVGRALSEPKLSVTDDPQVYLVEYGRDGVKFGYLIAQILPDAVLVRTFLLLTMGGTPEGNKLRSRLREQRNGKTHLRLDSLENVLKEAREDQAVRSLFKECGCSEVVEQALMTEDCDSGFLNRPIFNAAAKLETLKADDDR